MQQKQVICKQCGAVIPPGEASCPYCGSSYAPEAEREYMRSLYRMRNDLDTAGDAGKEASRQEIGRIRKTTARVVGVILILAAVLSGIFFVLQMRNTQNSRREYAWRKEALPELDRLLEEGDYDALLSAYQTARDEGHDLYNWEHYAFCEIYEETIFIDSFRSAREKGVFEEDDAVLLLYDELKIRGVSNRRDFPVKDRELIAPRLETYRDDLTEIFRASPEEVASFDRMLEKHHGYPEFDACREYVENHPEILIARDRK